MADVATTLSSLSDVDFEKKFNRKKPSEDTKIIISCRSGKRSAMVQSDILKLGYKKYVCYLQLSYSSLKFFSFGLFIFFLELTII